MKKLLALILALTVIISLAACSQTPDPTDAPTEAPTAAPTDGPTEAPADDPTDAPTEAPVVDNAPFAFPFGGDMLIPGTPFDAAAFPEADSLYQVPSCAIDGTDNVYNYTDFEVTAYNDGTLEIIYSIYILDPNTCTPEGLYLGDSAAQVSALYGDDYTEEGTSRIYQRGETLLTVIFGGEAVNSIEYRWANS